MNILSIGNSFSQDAQRYLHRIAATDGFELNTFNRFIGGCPLSRHYRNMLSDECAYTLEMNGQSTGFNVSLKGALLNRDWDIITIQQASPKSNCYDTYQPYLNKVVEFVKACVPKAKIAVHQTWAYEQGSERLQELGYSNHIDMFNNIKDAYENAAKDIDADILIPSGLLLQKLISEGIDKVHRDTFHLSCGVGRYAVGLLWYTILTGNSIIGNNFCDFDEEISDDYIKIAKKCVDDLAK